MLNFRSYGWVSFSFRCSLTVSDQDTKRNADSLEKVYTAENPNESDDVLN